MFKIWSYELAFWGGRGGKILKLKKL